MFRDRQYAQHFYSPAVHAVNFGRKQKKVFYSITKSESQPAPFSIPALGSGDLTTDVSGDLNNLQHTWQTFLAMFPQTSGALFLMVANFLVCVEEVDSTTIFL